HAPTVFEDKEFLLEAVRQEYQLRQEAGQAPSAAEYLARFGVSPLRDAKDERPQEPGPRLSDQPTIQGRGRRAVKAANEGSAKARESAPSSTPVTPAATAPVLPEGPGRSEKVEEWYRSVQGLSDHARLVREVHQADPNQAESLVAALATLPKAGERFLGFQL